MLTAVIGHVDILYTQAPRVSVNMHTKLYVFFCDILSMIMLDLMDNPSEHI